MSHLCPHPAPGSSNLCVLGRAAPQLPNTHIGYVIPAQRLQVASQHTEKPRSPGLGSHSLLTPTSASAAVLFTQLVRPTAT